MRARAGHGARAWVPLGFIVVALIVLLGTPIEVSRRVRRLRQHVTDAADEARLLVSDLEVAFARSLLAEEPGTQSDASELSSAEAAERVAERGLDSVVTQLDAEAVERLVALRYAEQRWRAAKTSTHAATRESSTQEARDVIAAAASLDQYLFSLATRGKQQVRRLEQFDLYSATVLTPIALVALGIVVWLDREVRAYAASADDRAEQLARSVELRATLIHGVVHDVKNPLGAASGYADLLEDGLAGDLNDQQSEMIRRVKRLLGTAQQTVSELVDLARVDAGEYPIERHRVNLSDVVRDVVDDYQARATQKSIALTLEAPRDPISLVTDGARVRHVLENLVSNAIKYTPSAGTVRVTMEITLDSDQRRVLHVRVHDSGPGVPAAYRDRIFDPFVRVPSAERAAPGSGMGLAISRRIARLLGGDVILAETSEHGSTFSLTLPLEGS